MPTSSVSSHLSWGVYLLASVFLILLLAPGAASLGSESRISAGSRTLDGVKYVLDGLRPGVVVSLTIVSTDRSDSVRLSGRQIAYFSGGHALYLPSRWPLPNATLVPGGAYSISLVNGSVEVFASG